MTRRIVFSRASEEDRRAITDYTVKQFGLAQAFKLRERFEAVITILADSPDIGQLRSELDPPNHAFRYVTVMKRFVVVYKRIESEIRIARILHGARDLAQELDRDAGDAAQA